MAQMMGLARIGRDAEVRYTPQGDPISNLSLAFSYGKKDAEGKKPTQWVDASLWGQRAEALAQHLLAGTLVYVVLDDVHQEEYQTRGGRNGSKIVGRISTIEFASKPKQQDGAQPAAQRRQQQAPTQPASQPSSTLADMDDDIPF